MGNLSIPFILIDNGWIAKYTILFNEWYKNIVFATIFLPTDASMHAEHR